MYTKLKNVKLKSEEEMEIGVVQAPDNEYADKIRPFLDHKPEIYKWHIGRCIEEELDELETYFYIGQLKNREIITNIMTVEHIGVGILGHVFTKPEHRRKGACTDVMASQMKHFRERGGRALYLGTGYDSPAYHIYSKYGFESVVPKSGFMKYYASPDFEESYFALDDVHTKDVQWHDWSKMSALTGIVNGDYLRSLAFHIYGPKNFEGGFLEFKHGLEESKKYHDAKLLETQNGAIVGFATIIEDNRWDSNIYTLDLFVHPHFWEKATKLIEAVDIPEGKIQCYADAKSIGKIQCLINSDFNIEAVRRDQLKVERAAYSLKKYGDKTLDILIFSKFSY